MVDSEKLKKRIEEMGILQADVAKKLNCSQSTVSLKINNKRPFFLDEAWELARMLSFHFLQPYMNRKCSPKELMPLPWDHDRGEETDAVSRDEARRRMERRIRKEVQ